MAGVFRVPMSGTCLGISVIALCLAAPGHAAVSPAHPAAAAGNSATELACWQSIATSNDIAQYDAYLARYPRGTFAKLARLKINALMAAQDAAGVPDVDVAGPIDEAPVVKAALPPSGPAVKVAAPSPAPAVMASAAGAVAQVADAAPLPVPAPPREAQQAAANAPWSAAQPALGADDLGRTQAQQDMVDVGRAQMDGAQMAQADVASAPWMRGSDDQEREGEEQDAASALPVGDVQQAAASAPLPPYFDREIEPPYRNSSPGRVRATLPLRPRMASFRPLRLPSGFCSTASRDEFFEEEFRPAADAAADNEDRANAYLRAVQRQYDHYKFDGDATGASITGQETAAYREIAGAASRLSQDFDAQYDAMMRLPVGGCR